MDPGRQERPITEIAHRDQRWQRGESTLIEGEHPEDDFLPLQPPPFPPGTDTASRASLGEILHSRKASGEDRTHWSPRMLRDRQPCGRFDIQAHWIEDSFGRLRYRDRVRNSRQATRGLRCGRSHTPSGGCGQLDGRLQQRGGRRLEERRLQDEKLRKEEAQAADERVRLMQRQRRRISRARWPNQGAALPTLKADRPQRGTRCRSSLSTADGGHGNLPVGGRRILRTGGRRISALVVIGSPHDLVLIGRY